MGLTLLPGMGGSLALAGDFGGMANGIYKTAGKAAAPKSFAGCSTQVPTHLASSCANAYEPRANGGETFFPWIAKDPIAPRFSITAAMGLGSTALSAADTGAMKTGGSATGKDLYHRLSNENCATVRIVDFNAVAGLAQVVCDGSNLPAMWINVDNLQCNPHNVTSYARFRGGSCPKSEDGLPETPGVKSANSSTEEMAIAAGHRFVERAQQKMGEVQLNADMDQATMTGLFENADPTDFYHRMVDSEKKLAALEKRATDPKFYGPDCTGTPAPSYNLSADQAIQGRRTCLLLQESHRFIVAKLRETGWTPEEDPTKADQPVEDEAAGMSKMPQAGPRGSLLMKNIVYADNISEAGGITYDQLVLRMTLFYGLKDGEQAALVGKTSPEARMLIAKNKGASGTGLIATANANPAIHDNKIAYARLSKEMGSPPFIELHNGYVFVRDGGDKGLVNQIQGEDCSTLAGITVLGDGKGKVSPSTYDLEQITEYIRRGRKGTPDGRWGFLGNCFDEVSLKNGETPRPGDLVYERDDVSKDNHVVIVQDYDKSKGEITTLELAGGKKSTLKPLIRSLYEPACGHEEGTDDWKMKPVKSDLKILRFAQHPGCPLKPEKM